MGGGGPGLPRLPETAPASRSHPSHSLPSSRGVCGWRQRGRAGRGALRLPPPAPPPPPGPPPLASPRAPPCKVESGVDVSESTWYRGWRIKSVELNSCHCSDSSRAERKGSERTSEQTSGALRGQRGRQREAPTERRAHPRAGAGKGVQVRAPEPRHRERARVPLSAGGASTPRAARPAQAAFS